MGPTDRGPMDWGPIGSGANGSGATGLGSYQPLTGLEKICKTLTDKLFRETYYRTLTDKLFRELYYLRLAWPKTESKITPYRMPTVFWKRNTGSPLCLDPMIKHIILPQVGSAQNKNKHNAIQGAHCVLETPDRGPTVF